MMIIPANRIQITISVVMGLFGLFVGSICLYHSIVTGSWGGFDWVRIIVPVLAGMVNLVTGLMSIRIAKLRYISKIMQISCLYISGIIAQLGSYNNTAAMLLFLMGMLLSFRYSLLSYNFIMHTMFLNFALILAVGIRDGVLLRRIILQTGFLFVFYFFVASLFIDMLRILRVQQLRIGREVSSQPVQNTDRIFAPSGDLGVEFTRKEYEVLVAMCCYEKVTNEELSRFLGVSVSTVKSHLNNIYIKTGIHKRSRLIVAFKDSLIEAEAGGSYFSSLP